MYNEVHDMIEKIYRGTTTTGDVSFAGWKNRARQTRAALFELRAELDKELDSMAGIWAQQVIDEKRRNYEIGYADVVSDAKELILADLAKVIEAKRERFSQSMGDPGAAAVNVLTLLNLRDHLSAGDIAAAVPHVADSLLGLEMLREIAHRHNVAFPRLPDKKEFEESLQSVSDYATEYTRSIVKDPKQSGYWELSFWNSDVGGWGLVQQHVDSLDQPSYLQINMEEIADDGKKDE